MSQISGAYCVPSNFGMYLAEDGTTLLVGEGQTLPESAHDTFGPMIVTRLVRSDTPILQPRLGDILRDLDESGFAVL